MYENNFWNFVVGLSGFSIFISAALHGWSNWDEPVNVALISGETGILLVAISLCTLKK